MEWWGSNHGEAKNSQSSYAVNRGNAVGQYWWYLIENRDIPAIPEFQGQQEWSAGSPKYIQQRGNPNSAVPAERKLGSHDLNGEQGPVAGMGWIGKAPSNGGGGGEPKKHWAKHW
jgi:hypothetical protein